jgi:hypothetical protein
MTSSVLIHPDELTQAWVDRAADHRGTYSVYGQDNKNVRLVDLSTGDVYKFPEEMINDQMDGGIRLRNIPLTDTPLMVLFGGNTEIKND